MSRLLHQGDGERGIFQRRSLLGDLIQSLIFKFHSYHMMPKFLPPAQIPTLWLQIHSFKRTGTPNTVYLKLNSSSSSIICSPCILHSTVSQNILPCIIYAICVDVLIFLLTYWILYPRDQGLYLIFIAHKQQALNTYELVEMVSCSTMKRQCDQISSPFLLRWLKGDEEPNMIVVEKRSLEARVIPGSMTGWGLSGGSVVKNLPANAGDSGSIPE